MKLDTWGGMWDLQLAVVELRWIPAWWVLPVRGTVKPSGFQDPVSVPVENSSLRYYREERLILWGESPWRSEGTWGFTGMINWAVRYHQRPGSVSILGRHGEWGPSGPGQCLAQGLIQSLPRQCPTHKLIYPWRLSFFPSRVKFLTWRIWILPNIWLFWQGDFDCFIKERS